jgi:hypothetical protein
MPYRLWGITPGINVAPRLVLALAVIGGAADFTGMAQADDGPPRRMLVRLDSDLLVPLIERPIEEVQAVDEMVLGVRMIGKAQVAGHPKVTLPDDPKDAAFSVTITGTINSRTTGRKGPVQIYSRSTTRFVATKRLTLRADVFNFLNHANLNQPDPLVTSPTFGVAKYGRTGRQTGFPALAPFVETARQVQIILRLEF